MVPNEFEDGTEVPSNVLNEYGHPNSFSEKTLQSMIVLVVLMFSIEKVRKEEKNRKLGTAVVNHGMKSLYKEDKSVVIEKFSSTEDLLLD